MPSAEPPRIEQRVMATAMGPQPVIPQEPSRYVRVHAWVRPTAADPAYDQAVLQTHLEGIIKSFVSITHKDPPRILEYLRKLGQDARQVEVEIDAAGAYSAYYVE